MSTTCSIDDNIGPWCVNQDDDETGENGHYIAIIKDLEVFRSIHEEMLRTKSGNKLREQLNDLIQQIEFGKVKMTRSNSLTWKSGDFVPANTFE